VGELGDDLVQAARAAIEDSTLVLYHRWEIEARAAVVATLRTLVAKHFPDGDVDYHYATEGLAQDVCDVLAELERES
jgi:hypothetical protein